MFLMCLNMHQVMSLPYRSHSDDGDEPGDHDAHLGVGDRPVGQGGHRSHHGKESKKLN